MVMEFRMVMYILYLKWITNKDLQYSIGISAQCYVAAWMEGGLGGNGYIMYVWLSPFASHPKLSQHCLWLCESVFLSRVKLFVTPQTVACQAPLSTRFSKQEYWSGLPFPSPEDPPNPGIKQGSLAL